ncbi:MAG TPA: thioredoxin domain-containing protein [Pyrinomonadaceae bacterium]|nr:thioredoxin domain-containing protein [Pyrinomonadaceae bacterium]
MPHQTIMKRYLPLIIIVAVLLIGATAFFAIYRSRQSGTNAVFSTPSPTANSPTTKASPPSSTPFPKPTNLPAGLSVTVEEFGDYQCPPCGRLHPEIKSIEQEYGNRLVFVFRNLPLTKIHANALIAAKAAEAARLQQKFIQMHDRLYERQDEWKDEKDPRPTFIRYAGELGLDTDRFDRDIDGPAVQQRLADDQKRADSMGVQGTPTVFVEGREMKNEVTNGEGIRKGIDLMLVKKASGQ